MEGRLTGPCASGAFTAAREEPHDAEAFRAREGLIARADIDEDWLASLVLPIVPAWEVTEPNHRDAILVALIADRQDG